MTDAEIAAFRESLWDDPATDGPMVQFVNATFMTVYRRELEKCGAKGRAAAHWMFDLGWTFSPGVLDIWLAGDRP